MEKKNAFVGLCPCMVDLGGRGYVELNIGLSLMEYCGVDIVLNGVVTGSYAEGLRVYIAIV